MMTPINILILLLTGMAGPLFRLAAFTGIVADLEGLAASLVFSSWQRDVPSVWHALRRERATSSHRG